MLPVKLLPIAEATPADRHPVFAGPETVLKDCEVKRLRRGGPGGQHRNKVETAVRIRHVPTDTIAEANEHRSQEENRKHAVRRLMMQLAVEVRTLPVAEPIWAENTHKGRINAKPGGPSGPRLVAHVLNVLHAFGWEVASAAKLLEVSTSQVVTFLSQDPNVLSKVNAARMAAGLKPLRR